MAFGQKLPEPHLHEPRQHRDGKPAWCDECGLTLSYEVPVSFAEKAAQHDEAIAPKVAEDEQLRSWYPILRYFDYMHLPQNLAMTSRHFWKLSRVLAAMGPNNPETAVALRKLLEAKDAAVRARLDLDNNL